MPVFWLWVIFTQVGCMNPGFSLLFHHFAANKTNKLHTRWYFNMFCNESDYQTVWSPSPQFSTINICGSHVWSFHCVFSVLVCPLGSVAAWVFAGDGAHLWLIAVSGTMRQLHPSDRDLTCSGIRLTQTGSFLWLVTVSHKEFLLFPRSPRSLRRVWVLVARFPIVEPTPVKIWIF